MRREPDPSAILMTLIVLGAVVATSIMIFWAGRRLARALFPNLFKPKKPAASQSPLPAPFWLLMIIGFGFIFWFFKPTSGKPHRAPVPWTWNWVLVPSGAAV